MYAADKFSWLHSRARSAAVFPGMVVRYVIDHVGEVSGFDPVGPHICVVGYAERVHFREGADDAQRIRV